MRQQSASKTILFLGIALLLVGIAIRRLTGYANFGLFVLLSGVGLKTYYIISKIRSGEYVPGKELWFLFVGLALFLLGLFFRGKEFLVKPIYLIVLGVSLKIVFILLFIQKVRKENTDNR